MYKIPQLQKYKNLFHVFSEKSDGNMANSVNGVVHDFDKVLENRKKFLKKVGVDINKTVCMWVTQGDDIVEASQKLAGASVLDYNKSVKVDGLMTNKKNLYLFLLIADCLPIIIYDQVKEAVALVHAGWKGIDLEIAKKAVEKFKSKYKSKPEDLVIGIGPCVRKESFIKENPLQKDDLRWRKFITPDIICRNRHSGEHSDSRIRSWTSQDDRIKRHENYVYLVDLLAFTKKQLVDAGVQKTNIFDCGVDTAKDDRFFSHVREKNLPISQQGRFACIVGMIK